MACLPERATIRDGTCGSLPFVHYSAWVTGVGDIVADLDQHAGQAEHVSVDIAADGGWTCRRAHAALAEFS